MSAAIVTDLMTAAHRLQVTDVPGSGFLIDGEHADTHTTLLLADLVTDGLLERASDLTYDTAYLTPTAAGLRRIGL